MNPQAARRIILDSFHAALAAVEPRAATARAIENSSSRLGERKVGVVAIGKAAAPMAWGAADALGERLISGVAVGSDPAEPPARIAWHTGSHPIPDGRSEAAGRAIMAYLEFTDAEFVLFLVSGGGSALAEVPPAGIGIDQLAAIQLALLHSGTPIDRLNLARRSLSGLKDGRLLDHVTVPHLTLLVSDVGDAGPEVIASGPTLAAPSSPEAVSEILRHAGVNVDDPIRAHLETLGPVRPNDDWEVVADGWSAARAAAEVTAKTGEHVDMARRHFSGEARRVAPSFVRGAGTGFTIAPGEATVTVTGGGRGGRNSEAALAVAVDIDGEDGVVFAALSTDGVDGASDATGAIVDGGSAQRIRGAGLSPEAALMNNDSHPALDSSGDLVRTGPTGTNVADLWFVWRS